MATLIFATYVVLLPTLWLRSAPPSIPVVCRPVVDGAHAARPEGAGSSQQAPDQAYASRMQEGSRRLQAGEFALAAEHFAGALELRPTDLQAWFLLGTAQRGAGDLAIAQRTFEELAAAHPDAPNGPFGLGQVHLLNDASAAAEASLREALRRDPDYARAWFSLGTLLQAQEQTDAAADAYREALRRNPTGRPSALALARLLLAAGAGEEALAALRPVSRTFPDDPQVVGLASAALAQLGRFDEATEMLDAVAGAASSADNWFNLGLLGARAGEWDTAENALARALVADPRHVDARILLAELLEGTGRQQPSEEVLEDGIAMVDDDRRLRRALAAMFINRNARQLSDAAKILRGLLEETPVDDDVRRALATVYADTGRLEPALELFRELAPRYPNNAELAYRIGYLQSHLGDNEAARDALQQALALDADHVDAAYELAVIGLRDQQFEDAAAGFERVVQQQPYRTGAYVNLARALRALGREEEAVQAAERSRELQQLDARIEDLRTELRLRPTEAANHLALGKLYVEIGRVAEAEALLRTALRIDPGLLEARDLLDGIQGR